MLRTTPKAMTATPAAMMSHMGSLTNQAIGGRPREPRHHANHPTTMAPRNSGNNALNPKAVAM